MQRVRTSRERVSKRARLGGATWEEVAWEEEKGEEGEWRGGFIFLPHPLLVFIFPLTVSFPWRAFVNECLLCGHVKKPVERTDGTMSILIRRQIVFRLPCQTRKLKNPQAIEEES